MSYISDSYISDSDVDIRRRDHAVLIRTREILLERGWCHGWGDEGDEGRDDRRVCVLHAMARASDDHLGCLSIHTYRVLQDAIGLPYHRNEVGLWNDRQPSIEPVLAMLDEAIAATAPALVLV